MSVPTPATIDRARPAWRLALGALALCGALLGALALRGATPADAAKARTVGDTKRTPKASCPRDPCEAIGSVTGFQQSADGKKGLFKAPSNGHVVAWSVKLAKPDKSQREFFGEFYEDNVFGTAASARLAILKPKKKSRFKLKRHSPALALNSALGGTPYITLNDPLRVKKGDVIGLTIPTWLSNFAVQQSRDDYWRASRSPKKCTGEADIRDSRPHSRVDSIRRYGCRYTTARILYWAYMVKSG